MPSPSALLLIGDKVVNAAPPLRVPLPARPRRRMEASHRPPLRLRLLDDARRPWHGRLARVVFRPGCHGRFKRPCPCATDNAGCRGQWGKAPSSWGRLSSRSSRIAPNRPRPKCARSANGKWKLENRESPVNGKWKMENGKSPGPPSLRPLLPSRTRASPRLVPA